MTDKPDFSELINKGYNFSIGESISDGWKLFSKGAGSYIGFAVVVLLIYFVSAFLLGMTIPFFGPFVFPILFIALLFGMAALVSGLNSFSRNLLSGKESFGDFFKGFESFGQLSLHYLVYFLMMIPLLIFYFLVVMPPELYEIFTNPDSLRNFEDIGYSSTPFRAGIVSVIGYFAFMFFSIYMAISYMYATPLITDAKLGFWEAMETSRKLVGKKFFSHFGLMFIVGILASIGTMLTCGLGMFVLYPFMGCTIFVAYNSIFGPYLNQVENQIDSFGSEDGNFDLDRDN
mgnify:CR=1 FL=1